MSAMNNVSLYIPHVFADISKEEVINIFESLRIGKVSNIDFVNKISDQTQYNAAYIHFEYWYDNTAARNFQERVLNPDKEARIVYDDPWYWIVLENKAKKHVSGDRKPRVVLDLQEKEEEVAAPAKQMMSNKDFSELINKPVKKWPGLSQPIAQGLQVMDDDAIMEELEALMDEEECDHLITIDGRYVQEIENENMSLRASSINPLYVQELEKRNQELMNELASLRGIMAQLSQRF
jgi:sporulation protein YlmC with PRC-barrel domain